MTKNKMSIETEIVHGPGREYSTSMDLVPPIHPTSTFTFKDADHGAALFTGAEEGYIYTRISNPTIDLLQEKMALLEGGESAAATSSGMSAIAAVALTLAKPGDNFIACNSIYGGTFALFNKHLRDLDIEPLFISPSDACSKDRVENMINKKTKFLFMETPANPTLDIIDIKMWKSVACKQELPLIVDNTFATPYLQNPLSLGADIVIHSATKYLSGHSDALGGIIIGSGNMINRIREEYLFHYGPVMSPFNAWLILRGIKTLALRVKRQSDSALRIAEWLQKHPAVINVYYPGIKSGPGYRLAQKQMRDFGGMLSFEVKGGVKAGRKIMNRVKLARLAVSLGSCETLIQHPASMTHSTYTKQERAKAGIADGLIRLSIGIEAAADIISDLENAMQV